MKNLLKQALLFCTLMLAASLPVTSLAQADAPTMASYALLSLIGNNLQTVVYQPTTGTRMDANNKHNLPIVDPIFDATAVESANAALKAILPKAKTVMMLTRDAGLYQAQNDMFENPDANRENRDYLKSLLKDRPVTQLILITKLHGPAELSMVAGYTGYGYLEGLGYYMDNALKIRNVETKNTGTGLLASFAYVKVRLLDAKTLDVIKEVYLKRSQTVGNSSQDDKGVFAWNILTPKEKMDFMDQQIRVTMEDVIPMLFSRTGGYRAPVVNQAPMVLQPSDN